jgi:hypothetical protein
VGVKEGQGRPVVIVVFEAVKNNNLGEVALSLSSRGVGKDLGEKGGMGARPPMVRGEEGTLMLSLVDWTWLSITPIPSGMLVLEGGVPNNQP